MREKDSQKERALDKSKTEQSKTWVRSDTSEYFFEKEPGKTQFLATSENEEEVEDYRQFRKAVLADQGKGFSSATHWVSEEDGTKAKSKTQTKVAKEGEKSREGKGHKVSSKDKHKDDDRDIGPVGKKDSKSPEPVTSEKIKDPFSYNFPLQQSDEGKENILFREESPFQIRMVATESHRPVVKLRIMPVPLDDAR